jgi:uncharacterized protein
VGCRRVVARGELCRFATVEGRVVPDPEAGIAGRGAWLHPAVECFEQAVRRRAFNRAFRASVALPDETVDFITHTWPRSASTS